MAEDAGWLDTNVFIHPLTQDNNSTECAVLLGRLATGNATGRIDPVVVHELTYTLTSRFGYTPTTAANYIKRILAWESIETVGDKETLISALSLWEQHGISFADALLAARAKTDGTWVCTENTKDIKKAGAEARKPG
ncbi:MAG: PIN domain-containing protein [Thermaerobacter sp.]|nr:PIN domain-containing protein [Thermaerobacter sp.]